MWVVWVEECVCACSALKCVMREILNVNVCKFYPHILKLSNVITPGTVDLLLYIFIYLLIPGLPLVLVYEYKKNKNDHDFWKTLRTFAEYLWNQFRINEKYNIYKL